MLSLTANTLGLVIIPPSLDVSLLFPLFPPSVSLSSPLPPLLLCSRPRSSGVYSPSQLWFLPAGLPRLQSWLLRLCLPVTTGRSALGCPGGPPTFSAGAMLIHGPTLLATGLPRPGLPQLPCWHPAASPTWAGSAAPQLLCHWESRPPPPLWACCHLSIWVLLSPPSVLVSRPLGSSGGECDGRGWEGCTPPPNKLLLLNP